MTRNSIILLKILQGNLGWQPKVNLARRYNTISVIYGLFVNQQYAMLVLRNSQIRMAQLVLDWSTRCNNRFAQGKKQMTSKHCTCVFRQFR